MSRAGLWDNPLADDFFFSTRQIDFVHGAEWKTRRKARPDLFEYIDVW